MYFRPGPTQTGLYSKMARVLTFRIEKKEGFYYLNTHVAKTKALISYMYMVIAQLNCTFVLTYAKSMFSHKSAKISTIFLFNFNMTYVRMHTVVTLMIGTPNKENINLILSTDHSNKRETTFAYKSLLPYVPKCKVEDFPHRNIGILALLLFKLLEGLPYEKCIWL